MTVVLKELNKYRIILASASPRRQQLLSQLGLHFDVVLKKTNEAYSQDLQREEIALFLAEKKSYSFRDEDLKDDHLLITADTIVWQKGKVLDKPSGKEDAYSILRQLSGNYHEVITAVCLRTNQKKKTFFACTKVYFKELNDDEIHYYIDNFQPYDKAGGYGIQEWIGYIGVEKIEGSFFNVMGLPIFKLYQELEEFLK